MVHITATINRKLHSCLKITIKLLKSNISGYIVILFGLFANVLNGSVRDISFHLSQSYHHQIIILKCFSCAHIQCFIPIKNQKKKNNIFLLCNTFLTLLLKSWIWKKKHTHKNVWICSINMYKDLSKTNCMCNKRQKYARTFN